MHNEREDDETRPTPIGPRHVIKNREGCYLLIDSLGVLWTSHLPNAIAWTTKEAADLYIARSFSPIEISARVIVSEDVSTWATRPLRVLT